MKTVYKRKDWLVEKDDAGVVRAVGPHGTALYADEAGVWIDHEVPSPEYEDAYVLERVAMPLGWFVQALRANGFKVTAPKEFRQADFEGVPSWAPDEPVAEKPRMERLKDAAAYLTKKAKRK